MSKAGTKGVSRADREKQIAGLAVEEFGAHGYAGASLAAIATRAEISKPLIYSYFGSKDGLALACVHQVGDLLVRAVDDAQADQAAGERALRTLSAIFGVLVDCRYAWSVLYDPTMPATGEVHAAATRYRGALSSIGAVGTAAVLRGAGDHDQLDHALFNTVWQYTVTAVVRWWLDHPEQSAADMTGRCARILGVIGGLADRIDLS